MSLSEILRRHRVDPQFDAEMHALVEQGQRPSAALRAKLRTSYAACLAEILEILSQPFAHYYANYHEAANVRPSRGSSHVCC